MRADKNRIRWGLLLLLWTLPGLLQALQELTYASVTDAQGFRLGKVLLSFVPAWYPWILFTPLVMALTRRFPIVRGSRLRSIGVHLLACIGFGLLHTAVLGLIRVNFPPGEWTPPNLTTWMRNTFWSFHTQVELLAYWVVLSVTLTIDGGRSIHERDVRTARLEGQLANARVAALRAQLQPHFLFNTLNAINVMMREDVDAAERMCLKLSALLRVALDHEGGALIPLALELEHIQLFLDIERVRFPDRLKVECHADPDTMSVPVPNMLLQPLVENAVRHGTAPLEQGGRIEIHAARDGEQLLITVRDDGVGFDSTRPAGVGLANTRERLREIYGERQSFEIRAGEQSGTEVFIRIPYTEADLES